MSGESSGGAGPSGSGGNTGAENGGPSKSYDHSTGSFAKNNASDLPGQQTKDQAPDKAPDVERPFQDTRPDDIKKQEIDAAKSEVERRKELTRKPISLNKFKIARKGHAPRDELSMETDLPYKESVDAKSHNQKLRKEDYLARRGQPKEARQKMREEHEKKIEAGQKPDIHSRESFIRSRYEKALKAKKPRDKSR